MRTLVCRAMAALLLAVVPPASALEPDKAFHHYVQDSWSIEAGLPQITVLAITQDASGYIWVGTQAGVARFDGVRFTAFGQGEADPLPGLLTQALLIDAGDRLWIGTYKGLAVHEERRIRAVPARDSGRFPALDVQDLVLAEDGSVLAATTSGLFVLRDGVLDAETTEPTYSLLWHEGSLWAGERGHVHVRDGDGERSLPLPPGAESAMVADLLHAQGRVWAATSQGLFVLDGERFVAFDGHPGLSGSPVSRLFEDSDGNLWVGAQQGLARLRGARLHEFVADDAAFAHRSVRAIFEDRERNLWLGSQWEGLMRLWNGWTRRYSTAEGLHEPILWSVAPAPGGGVYAGTNDGLALLRDGRFQRLADGAALPHPHAYTLLVEEDLVHVGTRAGLVSYRDGAVVRPARYAALDGAQVNGLLRDRDGRLWIASFAGLFRDHGDRLEGFGTDAGFRDPRSRLLLQTRSGRLLVGTQLGLYEFRDGAATPVGTESGLPADIDVTALAELANGDLLVGTLSEQLFLFHGSRWTLFDRSSGLPANSPFFIAEDGGFLWVAGIRGIYRVPMAQLRAYAAGTLLQVDGEMLLNERGDRRSGQQGYCCNGAGNAKGFLREGVLWLPTRDGAVAMATSGIRRNPVPPQLAIERIQVDGAWLPAAASAGEALPPDARDLGFQFTVLSFQDPLSVGIRYRLTGYDATWHDIEDAERRSANYTNLPPGEYRFEVMGSNNADVWAARPAQLPFSIRPRFHETLWFYLLLALLLAAVVYGGYLWKLRRLQVQQRALATLVQSRTEDLAAANQRLEEMSQTDPLTGLKNRRYLVNQLPADVSFYEREALRPGQNDLIMLIAIVDIDHFKQINDRYGHRAGDLVLQQFAAILDEQVRAGDYVVRWGGEEFLLVFRPMHSQQSTRIVERIRAAVEQAAFDIGEERPLPVTCSIGFVEYPMFRDARVLLGWEQMVELADLGLYHVKTHGRNGWAVFRPTASTPLATLVAELQADAEGLIASGRIEVVTSTARRPS